jgi:hypothetical protein
MSPLLNDILTYSKETRKVSLKMSFYKTAPFRVHSKIRSLQLNTNGGSMLDVAPTRYFEFVQLSFTAFSDVSMFQNVQQLILDSCSKVTDIQSISHTPYLQFNNCPNIEDFSCLGSQRCLVLRRLKNLKNSDIERFGYVRCLKLYMCTGITQVQKLWNCRFLDINSCNRLVNVHLEGNDYVKVLIGSCSQLSNLQVIGKAYCLELVKCGKIDMTQVEQYSDNITIKNWEIEWEEQYDH